MHRGKRDLGARPPGQPRCCHFPAHPFLSHLVPVPVPATHLAALPGPRGIAPCPDPAAFPAGSPYLLLRRPCPGAERLPRARARLQQRPGGKLEDENVGGRRDLSPRNCLAQFVLYKGGEYPRERSAHAFPHSWKSVTLCCGRIIFVGIFSPHIFYFFFFIIHIVKSIPRQVGTVLAVADTLISAWHLSQLRK